MEFWQFCLVGPIGVFCGIFMLLIPVILILWYVARKYRERNDWDYKGEIFQTTIKRNIERAVEVTGIKHLRNNPDEYNPPQPSFKHNGQVDFGDLVGVRINDGAGLRDWIFPPPDRLVLIPTELVTHRFFKEMVIDCNGWSRMGDLYIPIPRHDQEEHIEKWTKSFINWFVKQSKEPQFIMALSNGLEAQAKAHSMNPLERSIKDKLQEIATGYRNEPRES